MTKSTTATTNPDLNFERDRSRVDSLRLVSTRSIFFTREEDRRPVEGSPADAPSAEAVEEGDFMDSSFFEALLMEERRDL